jgi:hypothetical protein
MDYRLIDMGHKEPAFNTLPLHKEVGLAIKIIIIFASLLMQKGLNLQLDTTRTSIVQPIGSEINLVAIKILIRRSSDSASHLLRINTFYSRAHPQRHRCRRCLRTAYV